MFNKVDIEPRIDREKLFATLKIVEGSSAYDYGLAHFDELEDLARSSMELTVGYVELDSPIETGIKDVDSSERMVICLCSCTNGIVEAAADLINRGDFLEGYIIDGMVDNVLFDASKKMNDAVRGVMASRGLHLTDSIFPGECGADMSLLPRFLDELKRVADIEIDLTEGMMMYPEKSMLYAFGVGENAVSSEHHTSRCARCEMKQCAFRGVPR